MKPSFSVPATITHLQAFRRLPRTVTEAVAVLEDRFDRGILLYLYRQYFPDDFAASEESLAIEPAWSYSPREIEFLYLVNDHLFPLDLDYMSEQGAQGYRTPVIEPLPYHMHWRNDPFEQSTLGWQLLRLLGGIGQREQLPSQVSAIHQLVPEVRSRLAEVSLAMLDRAGPALLQLRAACEQAGEPLSGFALTLALFTQTTGNPWLDTDPDNEILFEGYCWCEQDFAEIVRTYQEAQQFEERVNAFALWLEQESTTRVTRIIDLIGQTLRKGAKQSIPDQEEHDGEHIQH